jgi:hypothetical protein
MRSRHKTWPLIITAVVVVLAATLNVLSGQGVAGRVGRGQDRQADTALTREEATPIQEGVMTQKQKEHSKLYKGKAYTRGRKIADLVTEKGDVEVWGRLRTSSACRSLRMSLWPA